MAFILRIHHFTSGKSAGIALCQPLQEPFISLPHNKCSEKLSSLVSADSMSPGLVRLAPYHKLYYFRDAFWLVALERQGECLKLRMAFLLAESQATKGITWQETSSDVSLVSTG